LLLFFQNENHVTQPTETNQNAPQTEAVQSAFDQLKLHSALLAAVKAEGYTTPTPIQQQAIPEVLAGRDLLGIAQTGTGKTAAFALPILHRLVANQVRLGRSLTRVLVLSPTRELASQIADSFKTYGRTLPVRGAVVYGGVSFGPQARQLQSGVDIVVATPGRLLDHIQQGTLKLDKTEIFVLDEADQMLDLGFMRDIRKIVALLPQNRQNLFFSATMPKEIGNLAGELLRNPTRVQVTPVAKTADRVEQRVVLCDGARKRAILSEILTKIATTRTLVFARTKRGADKVAEYLEKGGIPANAIHGNKSQGQRERALAAFRNGQCRVLVATDIAARGIDVDAVGHVINYDLPNVAESYVHRIGRTARAGAEGMAISLCDPSERAFLRDIERLIRQTIPRLEMPGENQPQRRAA